MKRCATCVNGLTTSHPDRSRCEECLSPFVPGEIYKHHVEGDPMVRLLKLQRSGKINIVIGGEGEHEVNAKWTIDAAYKRLSNVCEMCGGLCWKENPTTLILDKTYGGAFTLEYENLKLARIHKETSRQLPKRLWWTS